MKHHLHLPTLLLVASLALQASLSAQYATVSKSTAGSIADADAGDIQMSGDGRYVVFASKASTLAGGDTNGFFDVYLRDSLLGTTERISGGIGGAEPNGDSRWPAISDDGHWVVYGSTASNLVAGDTNAASDAFRYDRVSGATILASITWLGLQTHSPSADRDHSIDVSDDGRYVVFESMDDTLVSTFTGGATRDVFVRDVSTGTTTLVSYLIGATGSSGGWRPSINADGSVITFTSNDYLLHPDDPDSNNDVFAFLGGVIEVISKGPSGSSGSSPGNSSNARVTPDGRYVIFESTCSDLDPMDPYSDIDIFLRDRSAGTTEIVSLDSDGLASMYSSCSQPDVSADGRYVVFYSSSELTHVTHSIYHLNYVYLRDRSAGTTEFITIPRWWWPAIIAGGTQAQVADDGSSVVFSDAAPYQESPSSVHRPIVRRTRDGSSNLMSLSMYDSLWNGSSFTATGYDALPSSPFWVLRSSNVSGFSYQGHRFDLGSPITTMGSGASDAAGKITWTSAPLPSIAAGHTVYIELASRSGATWSDSNYVKFTIY